MQKVGDLFIYPLKSGRGIPMPSVKVMPTGLESDRHWMAMDATGAFVSQRTHPRLALVTPSLDAQTLTLRADGFTPLQLPLALEGPPVTVRVWKDRCTALDQGDEASAWLSEVIGDSVRIVRIPSAPDRLADPTYAGPEPPPVAFVDGFPMLICNRASLDDLNQRMPVPIPMGRFRPNIVLEGLPAFAEDRINVVTIGPVTLRLVKPSTRCVITSTDQQTGERSVNPLPVLRQFRFDRELLGVTFGENAVIVAGVGHAIERGADFVFRQDDA